MSSEAKHVYTSQFVLIPPRQEEERELSCKQSVACSIGASNNSYENLRKYFESYKPESDAVSIYELHSSGNLKLKKYREAVYYGQFKNNLRDGVGIMIYNNGRIYEGGWENDFRQGKGFEKFANGSIYSGNFQKGAKEKVGRYSWPSGEFYDGEWLNNFKHGSGMWRGDRGQTYVGQWKGGKADGYGVYTESNGDRYEGEFRQFVKQGQGIEKFSSGDMYKGAYNAGKFEGYGQLYYANRSYYKGSFKNGMRNNQGVWKKAPGLSDKYQGSYLDNNKSGYGIFTWKSGHMYKGNFLQDERNGYGDMFWADGGQYKGYWVNGVQNGMGEFISPGRPIKRGIFRDGVLVEEHLQSEENISGSYQCSSDSQYQQAFSPIQYKSRFQYINAYQEARMIHLGPRKPNYKFSKNGRHTNLTNYEPASKKAQYKTLESKHPINQITPKTPHSAFYIHKIHSRRGGRTNCEEAYAAKSNSTSLDFTFKLAQVRLKQKDGQKMVKFANNN